MRYTTINGLKIADSSKQRSSASDKNMEGSYHSEFQTQNWHINIINKDTGLSSMQQV